MKSCRLAVPLLAAAMFAASAAYAQHDHSSTAMPAADAVHPSGITASVTPAGGLKVGEPATLTISLKGSDGSPTSEADLQESHTEKVHLLIVDPSLTDYHHEHPTAGAAPGTYTFTITPRKAGEYIVFADLLPKATGKQETPSAAFTVEGTPSAIEKTVDSTATVAGYRFDLKFDDGKPAAGKGSAASLTVTGPDGEPFTQLEPVMGAFAHIVGFSEDRSEIAHLHPMGSEPKSDADRGGPTVGFHTDFKTAGYKKLFVQVQIGGKQIFAPFGVDVAAAKAGSAEVTQDAVRDAGNANCPISGQPVGSMQAGASITYGGYKVGLCCMGCEGAFKKDPEANLKKALAKSSGHAH